MGKWYFFGLDIAPGTVPGRVEPAAAVISEIVLVKNDSSYSRLAVKSKKLRQVTSELRSLRSRHAHDRTCHAQNLIICAGDAGRGIEGRDLMT